LGGTLVIWSGNYVFVSGAGGGGGGSYDPLGTAANTGQILYNDIVGLSGVLGTTGSTLYADITSLSGVLNTQTGASGILATNLASTGSNLYNDIVGLSGVLNTSGSMLYADLTGLSGIVNSSFQPFPKYTGQFTIAAPIYRYIWSGVASYTGTGIMPTPSSAGLSGVEFLIKNISTGAYLQISGQVDYTQNYTLYPLNAITLISDVDSWIIV
jgi:hypothetical protein